MLQHHEVEPARAAATLGVRAELGAAIDEQVADGIAFEQLGRERPAADTRRVRLHETDDALDRERPDARAGAHAPRDRVARRHERIRAVVEVEVGGLRALEQHPLLRVERLVHEVHGVVDVRLEARQHREIPLGEVLRVDRQAGCRPWRARRSSRAARGRASRGRSSGRAGPARAVRRAAPCRRRRGRCRAWSSRACSCRGSAR